MTIPGGGWGFSRGSRDIPRGWGPLSPGMAGLSPGVVLGRLCRSAACGVFTAKFPRGGVPPLIIFSEVLIGPVCLVYDCLGQSLSGWGWGALGDPPSVVFVLK